MEYWNDGVHYLQYSNVPSFHPSKRSFGLHDQPVNQTIVRSFALRREETAWKLIHPPGIGDALTTASLSVTGSIRTGASGYVFI
jgi:hypothetical protein